MRSVAVCFSTAESVDRVGCTGPAVLLAAGADAFVTSHVSELTIAGK